MNDVRVLIVADDLLVRTGLSALLDGQPDIRLVGQSDGKRVMDEIDIFQPDVVLWDLGWGVSDVRRITQVADTPLLALVADKTVASAVIGLIDRDTAFGVLARDSHPDVLVMALTALKQGLVVLWPAFTHTLGQSVSASGPLLEELTSREGEVLQLLAQGLTNKAIAHQLKITDHTVKFHVNAIMTKLNAQSRTDAVVKATRNGLVVL